MKKVLLIEDDPVLRENTAELLELSNYEVITAPDGKVGVITAQKVIPDIIVCDIMMPELDGYAVLKTLSNDEQTKYIPFIFLSAKTERRDVRRGMNLGADDYITKPFDEDELLSAIASRLAKVAILKELKTEQISPEHQPAPHDELKTLNDLKNFFNDHGEALSFSKGETIYNEGDHSNQMFLICKGIVKNHKFDQDGKELTTALHKEDDLFGFTSFSTNIPYLESATALKDTHLVALSKQKLNQILSDNHSLTLEIIQLLNNNLASIKEQLLQMAYSSVSKKTARTILEFAKKLNKTPSEPIKISRNDLASVAGIATETLIRTLSSFKKEGLIEIEGRHIKILDIDKLHARY